MFKINIGGKCLKIIENCFSAVNQLSKIFNKNTANLATNACRTLNKIYQYRTTIVQIMPNRQIHIMFYPIIATLNGRSEVFYTYRHRHQVLLNNISWQFGLHQGSPKIIFTLCILGNHVIADDCISNHVKQFCTIEW